MQTSSSLSSHCKMCDLEGNEHENLETDLWSTHSNL